MTKPNKYKVRTWLTQHKLVKPIFLTNSHLSAEERERRLAARKAMVEFESSKSAGLLDSVSDVNSVERLNQMLNRHGKRHSGASDPGMPQNADLESSSVPEDTICVGFTLPVTTVSVFGWTHGLVATNSKYLC